MAFCTANSPGNLSNKKYALLENTVSSDHLLAAFGSRSRISTLKKEERRKKYVNIWYCSCYKKKKDIEGEVASENKIYFQFFRSAAFMRKHVFKWLAGWCTCTKLFFSFFLCFVHQKNVHIHSFYMHEIIYLVL